VTIADLFFLASFLLVMVLTLTSGICAVRGNSARARRLVKFLGLFLVLYAVVLVAVALAMPRRIYTAGQRRCFDDWCVAAIDAVPADDGCQSAPDSRSWVASIDVSSVARRVRQRALDARADLEDTQGRRYAPCADPLERRSLADELGPGEQFRVRLPFRLPNGAKPAGVVVHHGDIPGFVIIGADQSFLHTPALQRLPD